MDHIRERHEDPESPFNVQYDRALEATGFFAALCLCYVYEGIEKARRLAKPGTQAMQIIDSSHRMLRVTRASLRCAAALCVTWTAHANEFVEFSIQPQSLETALLAFADQTDAQVATSGSGIATLTTKGVSGRMTPRAALERLIEGTDLEIRLTGERSFSLRARSAKSMWKVSAHGSQSTERPRSNMPEGTELSSEKAVESSRLEERDEHPNDARNSALKENATVGLETIIVTAQKRTERLQDVPISIAVLDSEEIRRRGLVSGEDYLRGIPGVSQSDSNMGPSVVIRGLETTTALQGFGSGSTVAMYFGETATTSSTGITGGSGADIKLVDIERIEVLRGPQGTAYGSSSLGGTIRLIPAKPNVEQFSARVAASYSNTSGYGNDNSMLQGVVNVPVTENRVALRAVGYRFSDSGFYHNFAGTDASLQAAAATFGAEPFATTESDVGSTTFTGGRAAVLLRPSDALQLTVTYLTQDTEIDGWAGSNRSDYEQAILRVGPDELVLGQMRGGNETTLDLANAILEYDFGWADLLATYSHIEGTSEWAFPWSTITTLPLVSSTVGRHTENSAEVRLSTDSRNAWNFLVGLFAEDHDDDWFQPVYWYGDPVTNPFPSRLQLVNDSANRTELSQEAAYGEASLRITSKITLTGGLRAYSYERTFWSDEGGDLTGPRSVRQGSIDTSGTNYRANLSVRPTSNSMLYLGWAEGFRLGKPQPGLPSSICDANGDGFVDGTSVPISSTTDIQSDTVESYEVGGKFSLLGGRMTLSADIFRAKWSEIPVQIQQSCGPLAIGYTANAGKATSDGIELQTELLVMDSLRISAGGSWIDASLDRAVPAQGFRVGDRLPSPRVNANLGVQYKFSALNLPTTLRVDATYVGRYYSTIGTNPLFDSGDYLKLDTSIGVSVQSVSVDLFIRNLTNADDVTYSGFGTTTLRLRPRTVGLMLAYEF